MNMSLVEKISSSSWAILSADGHPNIIEVKSKTAMRAQIAKLRRGEHLVIAFTAPWCGACKAYRPVYEKLPSADHGRHRFLWATGSFTRRYARYYPDVYIVNWKGMMTPVARYKVLPTLAIMENWKDIPLRPYAEKLFAMKSKSGHRRTTWSDMYALNRTIKYDWHYNNRLTAEQFWGLARKLDRLKGSSLCLARGVQRFSPMIYVNDVCHTATDLLSDLKSVSRFQPVLLYFTAARCEPCRKADAIIRDLALRYPNIRVYIVDATHKMPLTGQLKSAAGVSHLPYTIFYHGGKEQYRGAPHKIETTDAFQCALGYPQIKSWFEDLFSLLNISGNFNHLVKVKAGTSMADELLALPFNHPLGGVANRMIHDVASQLARRSSPGKWQKLMSQLPFYFSSFKSAKAMSNLARIAVRHTDVARNREACILVPASGHHVAPLVTAMVLIDNDVIDRADYIFTEINSRSVRNILKALRKWSSLKPELSPPEKLGQWYGHNYGRIHSIQLYWKGRPIRIFISLNESPRGKFFRQAYAQFSDIIILHDVGLYGTTPDDVTILPDVFAAALGDRIRDGSSSLHKPRILSINEFGRMGNVPGFINPFFAHLLNGQYGHGDPLKVVNNDLRTSTTWNELSIAPMPGTWMSLSPEDQPLLGALRYRWEIDYLVDIGIAAYDSVRNSWKEKPIRFHIKRGDIHSEQIDALWHFGLSLHSRLNKKSNAAKCLRYLMIRMLLNAFDECKHQVAWAKGIIDSFRYQTIPPGFKKTFEEFGLFISPGDLAEPTIWKEMRKRIKKKIDDYLILTANPQSPKDASSD